jgi:glycosyltransferase involved in cell wall biosynthesis
MIASRSRRRLRITLVNQFFPPDLSPTAHLTSSLAAHLAEEGHRVTVITGGEGYVGPRTSSTGTATGAVRVVHLWTPALGKGSVIKRLSDYASFLVGATVRMALMRRQDVIVSLTTPPYVVVSAMAHKLLHRRTRVVLWSMDCYPDVIERLGSRTGGGPVIHVDRPTRRDLVVAKVRDVLRPIASLRRGGPVSVVLRSVNRWVFRRLDHVVALDEPMRELLLDGYGSGPDGDRRPPATVIPNWEPLGDYPTAPDRSADGRWPIDPDDPELSGRFVVVYLGNLGFGHQVSTPVTAAGLIPVEEDVRWLFVGGGARWEQLAGLAATEGAADRILQRDYVRRDRMPQVMADAGAALIILGDEALGLMSPSKLHANLAAGLPILYVGPEGSNVDTAIARYGCGVSIRHGDAEGLAAAVCRLRDDDRWRAQLSAAARRAFEDAYCDRATLPQWDAVLGTSADGG